jgi:hypothetical protein
MLNTNNGCKSMNKTFQITQFAGEKNPLFILKS